MVKLAAGAFIAQAIILLTTPLLTRFYSPHDLGVSALVISFLTFLAPVSSLNYYQAIVLPADDGDALRLGELSIWLSLAAAVAFLGVFFSFRDHLGSTFKTPELIPYFWLIPAAVFVRSMYLVVSAWMLRQRHFGLQAKARVSQTLTERVLSLGAGFAGLASSLTLVFSRVLGFLVEAGILLLAFQRTLRRKDRTEPSQKGLRELAVEHREFPQYSSWAMLLANGSGQLPLLLLPVLFSPEVCGLYALADRLIQTPMQLLGESIRNVYYKELAERITAGRETRTGFIALRKNLVAVGFFPFTLLLVFGDVIFATLFGPEWARAGAFSGIIGFYLFFQFVAAPIASLFNAYRRQKYLVVISSLLFLNGGASLLVGKLLGSPEAGLLILSANGIVVYLFMNFLAERVVGAGHGEQFVTYGRTLLLNLPFIGALWVLVNLSRTPAALVAVCTALAGCYYGVLYRKKLVAALGKRVPP